MRSRRFGKPIFITLMLWLVLSPALTLMIGIENMPQASSTLITSSGIEIDSPGDPTYENGSLGKTITWNATTEDPKNYTITRNSESYRSGSWDGSLITVDLDHLYTENLVTTLPAEFTFECTVFNMQNESVSDSVTVTVIPDESPPIISAPANFSYEEGSFGHEIRWNITETNPDTYNITLTSSNPNLNDTVVEGGAWDGSNITISVDGLNATHWYLYRLFVNDTLGYNATSYVNVTVYSDTTPPEVSSPDDIEYEFGSSGHKIVWSVYDSNPKNYSLTVIIVWMNETYGPPDAGFHAPQNLTVEDWSFTDPEGMDITLSVDKLYLGNYSFTITLFDKFGLNSTDVVNVTVYEDVRPPIIDATEDYSYEEGHTGNTVNWSAEESNPWAFNLTLNGEVLDSGPWDGTNVSAVADRFAVGSYNFTLVLTDYFNQTSVSTVIVTVTPDVTLPIVSQIAVIQSYFTPHLTNLSFQAYAWDLNNITLVELEWGTDPQNPASKEMEHFQNDFYFADVGAYPISTKVWYRMIAQDNSSQQNVYATEWSVVEVRAQLSEEAPGLVWGLALVFGLLSTLTVMFLYFRTKTR